MKQETARPTVTLLPTATITITNTERVFVFELLESLPLDFSDELVTTSVETIVIVAVGLTADEGLTTVVVDLIELVGKTVIWSTKDETDVRWLELGVL